MFNVSMGRSIFGAVMVISVWCGLSYGYTCQGSEAANVSTTGNYVLGCPMGGIGGGNFNFLPDGNYNTTYIKVAAPAGAMPSCIGWAKGTSVWSSNLVNAGSVTTTFTGYWPTVTMKYTSAGMPVGISLEAFSPICAGDSKHSSLPLTIYIFTISNTSATACSAAVALSNGAGGTTIGTAPNVTGIKSGSVCMMVSNDAGGATVTSGTNASDFTADGALDNSAGGILASKVAVAAGATRKITFAIAWTSVADGYYRKYFTDAQGIATYGVDSASILKAKVDNWHNKILNSNYPDWFKDLMINSCHTYNSMTDWTNAGGANGTYGMNESSSSGNYGCIDQSYHGSMALPVFAPEAAWSEVSRIAGSQLSTGLISHFYPGQNEVRSDGGAKLTLQAYRDYLWTGNTAQLASLYTNIKNAIAGIRALDTRNSDGLPDDSLMNTYDNPYWDGWMIPSKEYDCELYLAALKAAAKIATLQNDAATATSYNGYFTQASASFEKANSSTVASSGFWNATTASRGGKTGYYTASTNINITKGQAMWACVLEGQWYADFCGLGNLHPENRIQSCLSYAQDVLFDPTATNPTYVYMAGIPPAGATHFGSAESPGAAYVSYVEYPAGGLCAAFQHNLPDVSMKALNMYWYITYSKWHRVYNVPCKVAADGSGAGWGIGRYMFAPGVFDALYNMTGFTPDIAGKTLRIKPSLPTGMDSLKAAPLMNPVSLGTVDYKKNAQNGQRFFVKFDSPLPFSTFYCGKEGGAQKVTVVKPGATVSPTIAVNTADTSEYAVSFGGTLSFDDAGVSIYVGDYGVPVNLPARAIKIQDFLVNMKQGKISYSLPEGASVKVCLVNSQGSERTLFHGRQAPGSHTMNHDWKKDPAGIYYVTLTAGDSKSVKRLVHVQ